MPGVMMNLLELFRKPSQEFEVSLHSEEYFSEYGVTDYPCIGKQNLPKGEPVKIVVRYYLTNNTILIWETTYVNNTLYIEVPHGCLPDASKDAFVALLEYAEEVLECHHAIVYFSKDREDRASLIRTFMFMGFFAAPSDSPVIDVPDSSNVYMVYKIR